MLPCHDFFSFLFFFANFIFTFIARMFSGICLYKDVVKLRGENLNYGFRVVARDTISWLAFLTCDKLLTWWDL